MSAVTVVLPLVPVIASTGSRTCQAKSSTSPTTGMPCATARRTIASSSGQAGADAQHVDVVEQRGA